MKCEVNRNLKEHILDGFARLIDLSPTIPNREVSVFNLESRIAETMRKNWEQVGKNMYEAINQYGSRHIYRER